MKSYTRRKFLKNSLLTGGAAIFSNQRLSATLAPAVLRTGSANGDIRIAVVGLHQQGAGHMRTYFKMPGARLAALCDVDSNVLARRANDCGKESIAVTTYIDYRKLLEDPNIDAVVLATPNHHHSLQTIWALQAGKDVYVEKPLSHNIWEGRQAVQASKKYPKNIVFAGTQSRSSEDIAEAIDYLRSGNLGKIKWARGIVYKQRDAIGRTKGPQAIPAGIDYDLWSGPADLEPPRRNSPTYGSVHYDWHWFWNYGGGDIANQGIHQMDVARWMLGEAGLSRTVMSFGGRFGYQDDAETPNTLTSVFEYKSAPLIFEVRGLPQKAGMRAMDAYRGTRVGNVIQCEGGYAAVNGDAATVNIFDNDNKRIMQFAKNTLGQHRSNFIKAVQSRKVSIGSVEECHYSSALCHLGNISYLLGAERSNVALAETIKSSSLTQEAFGRMVEHLKANDVASTGTVLGPLLTVDSSAERFVGADGGIVASANQSPLLKREGRGAFKIPVMQSSASS